MIEQPEEEINMPLKRGDDLDKADKERRELLKKRKEAAEEIIRNKEREIEEGVKRKLLEIEESEAEKIYKASLDINVKEEIEKRTQEALKAKKVEKQTDEIKIPEENKNKALSNVEAHSPTERTLDLEAKSSSEIDWLLSLDSNSNIQTQETLTRKSDIIPVTPVLEIQKQNKQEETVSPKLAPRLAPTKLEEEQLERKLEIIKGEIIPLPSKPKNIESPDIRAKLVTDAIVDMLLQEVKTNLFPERPDQNKQLAREEKKEEKKKLSGIKTALWNVESYISEVFQEIVKDPERFIASLSIPLNRDPIFILGQIQNEDSEYFDTIEQIITQPVLPVDFYLDLEHSRKVDSISEVPEDAAHETLLTEWSNIHNKCIFDAINDALDYYRPYGLKGPPLPWSKQLRELTYKNGSVASMQDILWGVKGKLLNWAVTNAGTLQLPHDMDLASILEQLNSQKSGGEKTKLDQYREERLEALLASEVK